MYDACDRPEAGAPLTPLPPLSPPATVIPSVHGGGVGNLVEADKGVVRQHFVPSPPPTLPGQEEEAPEKQEGQGGEGAAAQVREWVELEVPVGLPAMADGLGPILPSDLLTDEEETDEEGHDQPNPSLQIQEGRKGGGEPRQVVQVGEAYRGSVAGRAEASQVAQTGGGSATSTTGPVEGPSEGPTAAGGVMRREDVQDALLLPKSSTAAMSSAAATVDPLLNEPTVNAAALPGPDVDTRTQQERDDMELEARLRALLPPLSPPSNLAVISQPLTTASEGVGVGGGVVLSEASLSSFADILDAPTVQVRPLENMPPVDVATTIGK